MNYPSTVKEFAKVRMEQTPNNTQIARDIKNKFSALYKERELETIRTSVRNWRKKWDVDAKKIPIKRLFWDIETSYYTVRVWGIKRVNYIPWENIVKHKEIICISYKWQYEDKVHTLDFRMGKREMLKAFVKVLGEAHEIVGHNIDNFDIKELRTQCIAEGVLMFPNYRSLDTLKKARQYFRFPSNKLDYISSHLNKRGKVEHEGMNMWVKIMEQNDEQALEKMIEYCEGDVIITEDTYFVMSPFINHNNNFAVLTGGKKWECPECTSKDVKMFRTYSTPMGVIRREMKCNQCKKQYRISNKSYMNMLVEEMQKN